MPANGVTVLADVVSGRYEGIYGLLAL